MALRGAHGAISAASGMTKQPLWKDDPDNISSPRYRKDGPVAEQPTGGAKAALSREAQMAELLDWERQKRTQAQERSVRQQMSDIWQMVQLRAVWQPCSFVFVYNMLQLSNPAWSSFLIDGLGFTNDQLGAISENAGIEPPRLNQSNLLGNENADELARFISDSLVTSA